MSGQHCNRAIHHVNNVTGIAERCKDHGSFSATILF